MSSHLLRIIRAKSPFIDYLLEWVLLLYGALIHLITGSTPPRAHQSLVNLFTKSQGKTNDLMSRFLSMLYPPYKIEDSTGILHTLRKNDQDCIQSDLERDGYHIFNERLSSEFCDRILQKSLLVDCRLGSDEIVKGKINKYGKYEADQYLYGKYDPSNPIAVRYDLQDDDTVDIEEVQELLSDPMLIIAAQNYLKSKSIFSGISLYWSAKTKNVADSHAAQEFHFDMERIRWLRYFIYLTDVDSDSGPHCFIKGSHRTGAIPQKLLKQGYVRHSDEVLEAEYGREAFREFTAPKGTIIAEDSRGFHKGKPVIRGNRLILAFELSNSIFGANRRPLVRTIRSQRFRKFSVQYPRLYLNFDFGNNA